MYNDVDIETAVEDGAIDRETADRLRASIAERRGSTPADDESFRLVTGFNDIFVTIAAALVVFAAGTTLGGLAVAAVAWGLAEHFTRRKRMALPSIFLLLCFAGGVFSALARMAAATTLPTRITTYGVTRGDPGPAFLVALAAASLLTAAAVFAHWRRFHVPITIAALASAVAVAAGSGVMLLLVLLGLDASQVIGTAPWVAFVLGLGMFAYAMRWDLSDPERVTRRSDVAFWLHLAASPLIVHPLFLQLARLGMAGSDVGDGARIVASLLAIMLYAALGLVALVVDRRAMLVSALAYVVIAMGVLMRTQGEIGTGIAGSGAVIGALLLAMSVFWRDLRRATLRFMPERFRLRLPETD